MAEILFVNYYDCCCCS